MTNNDPKLTPRDYVDLAIEAGIGAIPYVGGSIQTLYFGRQNEIRFKRIETFYQQLNERLSPIENSLPSEVNDTSKEQLVGIIETINSEVEKSRSKNKTQYFVNAYKNLLLHSSQINLNEEELYVNILSDISNIEIQLLAFYFRNKGSKGKLTNVNIDASLLNGSMNRLANFGLINKHLESIAIGGGGAEDYTYSISSLGINFCQYILS